MDEKVINSVLDDCNGDLNEALEKLTELSLTSNGSEQCAGTPPAGGSGASPRPPQTTTNEPVGQAAFSGRQTSRDEEVERWAVVLCNEVASASGRQDLYQRTYNFLSSCKQHMETREAEKNHGRCIELAHQNSVLKKAVTIQHQRSLKSNAEKDSQLLTLRNALAQLQERSQVLEAENYALTVHLKQATAGQSAFGGRPPDVF